MVTMRWFSLQVAVLSCIVAAWAQPLSFFKPVVDLGADDIDRIPSGRVVTRTIHASSNDLGVRRRIAEDHSRRLHLPRHGHRPAEKESSGARDRTILESAEDRRPRCAPLSAEDVNDLSECRAGDCGLKLAVAEIRRMQAALATGKVNHRSTVERTFREILLERVRTYPGRWASCSSTFSRQESAG